MVSRLRLYNNLARDKFVAYVSCDSTAIYHGDTVALQSFMKNRWLGCSQSNCELAPCPKMEMAGSDWTNCQGEVFQIYRAAGQGTVRVGDLVAFYFPQSEGNWLGCAGSSCKKATCPGNPSIAHGFSTADKWHKCGGEVFGIYAKGKANGEIVNSDDDISLFLRKPERLAGCGTRRACQ